MKKYRVNANLTHVAFQLKEGDIVTLVEGSKEGDLYELPKRLHGEGHRGSVFDKHLDLKEYNYLYLYNGYVEEIKEERNENS